MMDKWNQQLFDVIGRSRSVSARESKAASITQEEPMVTISMKVYSELLKQDGQGQRRESKAASILPTETVRMPLREYRELVIN